MAEPSFTPGPWHTVFNEPTRDGAEVCSIYDASNDPTSGYVADVYRNHVGSFISKEEYRANARLIAQAPAMLEALEALLHAVCGETGFASAVRHDSGFEYPWPALDLAEEKARAAISDASGEAT